MLNFRVFTESVRGSAAWEPRAPHRPFFGGGVNGVNDSVWCTHFQTEAAVLKVMDKPCPRFHFLKKIGCATLHGVLQ